MRTLEARSLPGPVDFWASWMPGPASNTFEGDLHAVLSVFKGAVLHSDGGTFVFGMDERFSDLRKSDVARGGVGEGSNDLLIDPDCDLGCHGLDSIRVAVSANRLVSAGSKMQNRDCTGVTALTKRQVRREEVCSSWMRGLEF